MTVNTDIKSHKKRTHFEHLHILALLFTLQKGKTHKNHGFIQFFCETFVATFIRFAHHLLNLAHHLLNLVHQAPDFDVACITSPFQAMANPFL